MNFRDGKKSNMQEICTERKPNQEQSMPGGKVTKIQTSFTGKNIFPLVQMKNKQTNKHHLPSLVSFKIFGGRETAIVINYNLHLILAVIP